MDMCHTLRTTREILNKQDTQTGVNVEPACLYLRGNVSVGMSRIFWRKTCGVDCMTQPIDRAITSLNSSALATSCLAFM